LRRKSRLAHFIDDRVILSGFAPPARKLLDFVNATFATRLSFLQFFFFPPGFFGVGFSPG
jgi:hypothetical protein